MVLQVQQAGIRSETGLHYRVVGFVEKYYPYVLLSAAVGENQDTSQKRIDAWKKRFVAGAQIWLSTHIMSTILDLPLNSRRCC